MANKLKGEVEIVLGDKPRKFLFNSNALAELEGLLGRSGMSVLSELETAEKAPLHYTIRACLFVSYREATATKRRNVTIEKIGRLMSYDEMNGYVMGCIEGILAAYGHDFEEVKKKAEDGGNDPLGDNDGEGEGEDNDPLTVEEKNSTSENSEEEQSSPA